MPKSLYEGSYTLQFMTESIKLMSNVRMNNFRLLIATPLSRAISYHYLPFTSRLTLLHTKVTC